MNRHHPGLFLALSGPHLLLLLHIWTAWPCLPSLNSPAAPGLAIVGLLTCWLLSDLLTGIIHWLLDSYGAVDSSWFGRRILAKFREHHADPERVFRESLVTSGMPPAVLASIAIGSLTIGSAVLGRFTPELCWPHTVLVAGSWIWYCGAFGHLTHIWAHQRMAGVAVPRPVIWLQDAGGLLSACEHSRHHEDPTVSYAALSGLTNRFAERVELWRRLEKFAIRWLRVYPLEDRRGGR